MIYQLFDNIELVGDTVFDILFGNTDYYEMISTDDFTDVILQKNMSSYVKYQKSFCQSFFFEELLQFLFTFSYPSHTHQIRCQSKLILSCHES